MRSATRKSSTELHEMAYLDEAELILFGGSGLIVMVFIDDASSFRVFVPACAD